MKKYQATPMGAPVQGTYSHNHFIPPRKRNEYTPKQVNQETTNRALRSGLIIKKGKKNMTATRFAEYSNKAAAHHLSFFILRPRYPARDTPGVVRDERLEVKEE